MKIGILYICTGKYKIFWKDFYLSMEKNFINDTEKHYFVFTDSNEIDFEKENQNIHRILQKDLGWPNNTLMRFHMFLEHEEELIGMDYLFFFNANLLILEKITSDEFLPKGTENLVATLHPGFFNKKRYKFTYEKNFKSKAYIPKNEGKYYFAGGLNGGKASHFIDAMRAMKERISIDEHNNITAIWHDESHWNKYLIGREDIKILSPSYLSPEGWKLPFQKVILIRDKNKYGGHSLLRNKKESFIRKIFYSLKKNINFQNLFLFFISKRAIQTQGVDIRGAHFLIVSIAYNNSDIIQIQHKHLKENLEENFIYLVADNSNDNNASSKIENYCGIEKIPYVKLPKNPYKNPSKSHGIALQWVYKNIVKLCSPQYFGFLDHDIFPYKKTSIIPKLRDGIFGLIQERGEKWYLWPGFCFYDFNKVKKIKLNFMPSKGLDTGGSNYYTLYKEVDKKTLLKIPHIYTNINTGEQVQSVTDENTSTTVENVGDWLHIMRASNWNSQKNNKTSLFEPTHNSTDEKIDVVIPVYNGQKYIVDAITSVVNQTLPPKKIIVVDDGSTDNTNKIVSKYATTSKIEIKIVKKDNSGLSSARNAGIKESTSNFIAFLDVDDTWYKDKLEEQIKIFKNSGLNNLGLVYCDYDVIDMNGNIVYKNYKSPLDKKNMRGLVFKKLLERNQITSSGSGVLVKREVFDKVGLFDEKLRFGEDWDMWLRISEKYEVDFKDKILVHIRKHGQNMTFDPIKNFEREVGFYAKWIDYLKEHHTVPLFWADKITYRVLLGFYKTNLLRILRKNLSKQQRKKLFYITGGSFYLYLPIFFFRQIKNIFLYPKYIEIVLGLLKYRGK